MSEPISELRKITAAATPGPWGAADGGSFGGWWISLNGDPSNVTIAAVPIKLADADHIARFDPPAVSAMLDVIEAAGEALRHSVYHTDLRLILHMKDEVELQAALARFRDLSGGAA